MAFDRLKTIVPRYRFDDHVANLRWSLEGVEFCSVIAVRVFTWASQRRPDRLCNVIIDS